MSTINKVSFEDGKFSCENMDRSTAVLIFKNKIYEHDNHYYAIKEALNDFDYIDNKVDIINEDLKIEEGEYGIFTLSVYDDKYLVANCKESLIENKELLECYAQTNNYRLGYFINNNSSLFSIL